MVTDPSTSSTECASATCTSCSTRRVLDDAVLAGQIGVARLAADTATVTELRGRARNALEIALRRERWILWSGAGDDYEPVCGACVEKHKVTRATAECPPWCTTDHAREDLRGEWLFRHAAPDFGDVEVGMWTESPMFLSIAPVDWDLDTTAERTKLIDYLTKLSADALAAAQWLADIDLPHVTDGAA